MICVKMGGGGVIVHRVRISTPISFERRTNPNGNILFSPPAYVGVIIYMDLQYYDQQMGLDPPAMSDIVDHLQEECAALRKPDGSLENLLHRDPRVEEIKWPKSFNPDSSCAHVLCIANKKMPETQAEEIRNQLVKIGMPKCETAAIGEFERRARTVNGEMKWENFQRAAYTLVAVDALGVPPPIAARYQDTALTGSYSCAAQLDPPDDLGENPPPSCYLDEARRRYVIGVERDHSIVLQLGWILHWHKKLITEAESDFRQKWETKLKNPYLAEIKNKKLREFGGAAASSSAIAVHVAEYTENNDGGGFSGIGASSFSGVGIGASRSSGAAPPPDAPAVDAATLSGGGAAGSSTSANVSANDGGGFSDMECLQKCAWFLWDAVQKGVIDVNSVRLGKIVGAR